jgi:GR25 family glycosyltransferase involved in LPS biosynthesis
MIVKNESHIVLKTLNNLCSYIDFSYWVICDTGSTDNTKELIKDFFKEKNIKGELLEHKWKDFGYNRSNALKAAYNKTDYVFIFDADDEIIGDFQLPNTYDCDRYTLKFGKDFLYVRPLLFNNRKRWCFKGVLHEYLSNIDEVSGDKTITGDYHIESGRTGDRSKNPNKYIDDANILKKAHYDEFEKDYNLSCRYAFYCAQSYKDSGPTYIDDAIEWYKKCLGLNMWLQEKFHSCFTLGELYMIKKNNVNALKYWYKTIEYDSERIDGIVNAVSFLRNDGQHLLVNALYHKFKNYNKKPEGKLFLFQNLYQDQLEYQNAISAFYVNDKESGYACCKQILINKVLPYNLLISTIKNCTFYIDLLKADTNKDVLQLFYSFDSIVSNISNKKEIVDENIVTIWNTLFDKNKSTLVKRSNYSFENRTANPKILLTFTTCKRVDLFKQTVNSMLNHWLDIDKVDYWFCVDDNSTEVDRNNMKISYPWVNYYNKTIEEKGHLKSMNIIWDKLNEIKPVYWIHMEDDFLFYSKMNYIEEAINAMNHELCTSSNVKQVLFNRNYGETIESYNTRGHILNNEYSNIALHHFVRGTFPYPNCHYWPHYSFRPSLIDVKTILELGNYDSENTFFEMDYANKWAKAGYTSAFFNKMTNRHIGRLTSDRGTKNVKNAYDLNNENQFYKEEPNKVAKNINIKIVNLARRPDRKEETVKKLETAGIYNYEFIKAVDGQVLEPTQELFDLFKGNDFGSRKGFIGCALSHYSLWKQLLDDKNHEYYLIMEDDFSLCINFKDKFELLINDFTSRDCLFLGYTMFEKNRQQVKNIYDNESLETVKVTPLNKELYIGGTFCYSINKKGARKIVDYVQNNGIKHGIDYVMKITGNLECHESQPQLVFSDWSGGSESGQKIDSDIQNYYDCFDFSNVKKNLKENFVFIQNLDQHGNDMYHHKKSLEDQMEIALKDNLCFGFNTLGFFKNKIDLTKLKSSPYFSEKDDGLYIKKEYYYEEEEEEQIVRKNKNNKNIRVKMLCNWCSSEQLCKEWSNMCEEGFVWKNIEFVWTNKREEIDYYVIINFPPKDAYFEPLKTIVFQMEPWVNDATKNWGVKTWGEWADPDPDKFLRVFSHKSNLNAVQWQINIPLNQLKKSIVSIKQNGVFCVCSSKNYDEGHILRNNLIKYLEEKEINIHVYGRKNYHHFKSYNGPLLDDNKFNAFSTYKYCFSVENNSEYNYATEKLWEPILCESLCFYYGCPNVTDYIDSRAFVLLDINDFEKSYQIIKQAIDEDLWSQRIDFIRQEKQRILNELAFFPTIQKIINETNIKQLK